MVQMITTLIHPENVKNLVINYLPCVHDGSVMSFIYSGFWVLLMLGVEFNFIQSLQNCFWKIRLVCGFKIHKIDKSFVQHEYTVFPTACQLDSIIKLSSSSLPPTSPKTLRNSLAYSLMEFNLLFLHKVARNFSIDLIKRIEKYERKWIGNWFDFKILPQRDVFAFYDLLEVWSGFDKFLT